MAEQKELRAALTAISLRLRVDLLRSSLIERSCGIIMNTQTPPRQPPRSWVSPNTTPKRTSAGSSPSRSLKSSGLSPNGLLDDETIYLLRNTALALPRNKANKSPEANSRNIRNLASKLFSSPNSGGNRQAPTLSSQSSHRSPSGSPSLGERSYGRLGSSTETLNSRNSPSIPQLTQITESSPTPPVRRARKVPVSRECLYCNELLTNTLDTVGFDEETRIERAIELKCGEFAHEKCLIVLMEDADSSSADGSLIGSLSAVFPDCTKCNRKATPLDPRDIDLLLTARLMSITRKDDQPEVPESRLAGSPVKSATRPSATVSALGSTLPRQHQQQVLYRNSYRSPVAASHSRNSSLRVTRNGLSKALAPPVELDAGFIPSHKKRTSRGSSVSAISSIISSVSESSASSTLRLTQDDEIDLALRRSLFLSSLLAIESLKLSDTILDSFGLLRLADKMLVSKDEINWSMSYCYLFSYQLLILDISCKSYYTVRLVSGMSNSSLDIPQTSTGKQCIFISTPSPSVIKLGTLDKGAIFLSGTVSPIVEKWGAALSDLNLMFPSNMLSGSIEPETDLHGAPPRSSRASLSTIKQPPVSATGTNSILSMNLEKPATILLIINQLTPTQESLTVIKNIIMSMTLIRIEVVCIFTYDDVPSLDSPVAVHEVVGSGSKDDAGFEDITSLIKKFHTFLQDGNKESQALLKDVYSNYISSRHSKLEKVTTVAVSTTPLRDLKAFPTQKNVFVEVTTTPDMKLLNNRHSVMNVTRWDDVMEYICQCLGLEFDESDFESSSDEDDESATEGESSQDIVSPTEGLNSMRGQSRSVEAHGKFEGKQRWSDLVKDVEDALNETL
ncbi:unnamed protein product [Kuraishia capsulata CBS 1993]|uniref:Uncharacterized protein n=1 Tax=Kuraishia capsulata CBS 1993 TaxID=1382522 RepID=W6MV02_9ASCO|nr:uncharacterized protein KUCA_T00005685001 [Kuraishia capsulata CBS 1993]CDK29692.1 unnamed protein product [Kuraishia capsulata CBS 1993]